MKWFQSVLAAVATVQMVLSPVFAASSPWTTQEKAQLSQYRDYLEPMGYSLTLDNTNKKALVYDKKTNQLAMEIPFTEEGQLRKFSPKALNQRLMAEMIKIKSSSGAAFSHSLQSLPSESAIFFVAMGAVVAGQLLMNYSQNPVGMEQHIHHSISPIGIVGFFSFMYSQGVTSNMLAMYLKNPRYHHMIPYLGMTVGAFVQSYLSQIASDPNVKACARQSLGYSIESDIAAGADKDPCSKAYEYLVIQKKIWEFAPGIVSMLISSGLAAGVQSLAQKAVLRLTGVDIAMWLVPGSMQFKGWRLVLVKGLQITAFAGIDAWLNRKVTYAWKNIFDGADFRDINDRLNEQVNQMKSAQWKTSDKDLQNEVKNFRKKMTEWRMMNMSEVYEAHQNWSTALQQLTSMYNTSYAFYNTFANEIRNSRFDESPRKPLESIAPLNGVTAKDLVQGKEDLILSHPHFIENMQLDTITEALPKIDILLKQSDAKFIFPAEKAKLVQIIKKIKSDDKAQIGLGLKDLVTEIEISVQNTSASIQYRSALRAIYNMLGRPDPMMEAGRGFLAAYEFAPSTADTIKGTNYYRQVGQFKTPKMTDYLVMQMLCGPDVEAGQQIIKNSSGFSSVFLPPQLKNSKDKFQECEYWGTAPRNADAIYKNGFRTSTGKSYTGAISYLVNEARNSAIGAKEKSAFPDWWTKQTEPLMQKAFADYEKQYNEIVVNMMKGVYLQGRSVFNGRFSNPFKPAFTLEEKVRRAQGGPIYNGAMNSAFQEERVYLALLNELIAPTSSFKLDMAHILEKAPTHPALIEVERQFAILNGLIKRIKIVKNGEEEVIQSNLENYQLEEQLTAIQSALTKVSTLLGVGDGAATKSKLNIQQRNLAVTALENLQSLASEIMMYGSMANAVSWDKIRNLKRLNMEQNKFNNEVQAKLAQIRGMSMSGKY